MRAIYVEKQLSRLAAVKALQPFWPGVIFGPLSHVHYAEMKAERLPGSRWVRVRNRQCGICGSDLAFLFAAVDLSIAPAALPTTQRLYLGHEIVGFVSEVGPGVTRLKVGDRVIMDTRFQGATCHSQEITAPCGHCVGGNYMLCENTAANLDPQGVGGGFGDEFVAHETELYRVPGALTDDQAMMVEPFSTGLRTVLRRPPRSGGHALIVGGGNVGLNVLQCLRAVGPNCHVTVLARYQHQAYMARRLGADAVISDENGHAAIAAITQAKLYRGLFGNVNLLGGFDVVYDCVGSAPTLQNSLRWARAGGAVVMVGITMRPLKLDLNPIWHQEVDLLGVFAHGAEPWEGRHRPAYDIVADLLLRGQLTIEGLITHRFPFNKWKEAVKAAVHKSSGSIKVVLDIAGRGAP